MKRGYPPAYRYVETFVRRARSSLSRRFAPILPRCLAWLICGLAAGTLSSCFSDMNRPIPVTDGIPAAPDPKSVAEAQHKGIQFLLTTQNTNGTWGSFHTESTYNVGTGSNESFRAWQDSTTGLCLMALIIPAHTQPAAALAVNKAAHYLFDQPPVLRESGQIYFNVWAYIYVLESACAILRDPFFSSIHDNARHAALENIALLERMQSCEGGFSYYDFDQVRDPPTGKLSTSFMTAAALIALHHAQDLGLAIPPKTLTHATQSLARTQLSTGAYCYANHLLLAPSYLPNQVKGSLGRSQVCNLALWLTGKNISLNDLKNGLHNFFIYHHFIEIGKGRPVPHEAWYKTAGYYFYFGHYYAAQVARELPPDDRTIFLNGLQNIIFRNQDADGSWWDYPLYGYYKAYGTAFALLTLQLTQPLNQPSQH